MTLGGKSFKYVTTYLNDLPELAREKQLWFIYKSQNKGN